MSGTVVDWRAFGKRVHATLEEEGDLIAGGGEVGVTWSTCASR